MNGNFRQCLRAELKSNRGFRTRLALLGYRLGYCVDSSPHPTIGTALAAALYPLSRFVCQLLSVGEMPARGVLIDWGLRLPHMFLGCVLDEGCVIGKRLTLFHNTTLGRSHDGTCDIRIGDNVFIGAHCLIIGTVRIGDNCIIGPGTTLVDTEVPANTTVMSRRNWVFSRVAEKNPATPAASSA